MLSDDHYGYFDGKTPNIGFRTTYLHEYVFRTYQYEDVKAFMHAGIGAFLGYLHDGGTTSVDSQALTKEMGWTFGLASSVGLCLDFSRRISIDLSFLLTPAFNYRTSSYDGSSYLSLYINGLTHSIFPRIAIYYNL